MVRHCAMIVLLACTFQAVVFTDLEAVSLDKKDAPQVIRLGVITLYHPLVMYKQYQPFVDFLSETTPYSFELKVTQNYMDIIMLLCDGGIDLALLGGLTYIEAEKASCGLPFLAALNPAQKPVYQGTFIAREENTAIQGLQDIKGKRFAFASEHSTSGHLAPLYYLYAKENIHLEDLSAYKNLNYHDSVAREVLRGNCDAGVVLDSVAEKYQGKGIKSIGQTDPLPGFLLVVRPDLDQKLMKSLQETLLSLDYKNPKQRAMMDTWDVNIRFGFSKVIDSSYNPVRQMILYLKKQGIQIGVENEIFSGRSR